MHQGVREPPPVDPVLAHQARRESRVEVVEQVVLPAPRAGGEGVEVERPAHHGGSAHDGQRGGGQVGQAPAEDVLDGGRRVLGGERVGVLAGQARELDEEEGVALGALAHGRDLGVGRGGARHDRDHLAGGSLVETGQREAHGLAAGQPLGELAEGPGGSGGRGRGRAPGEQDEEPAGARVLGEQAQDAQGRDVRPVQVVEDEQEEVVARRLPHRADDLLPGPEAGAGVLVAAPQRQAGAEALEDRRPGVQRRGALVLGAAGADDPATGRARRGGDLLGQAGLADPGLAGDHHEAGPSLLRGEQGGAGGGELGRPAGQGGGGGRGRG